MEQENTEQAPVRLRRLPSWQLTQSAAYVSRAIAQAFAAAGARGYHYRLLAALEEFGPMSQADLGRRCGIDRSDVVAAVNELAESGFVERSPDESDRRRNVITITPAGIERLQRLDGVLAQAQAAIFAPLDDDERTQLVHLLDRLRGNHTQE